MTEKISTKKLEILTPEYLQFDYNVIPTKHRLGTAGNDLITLYRGDKRSLEESGIISSAVQHNKPDEIQKIKEIIKSGSESLISDLIDKHTSESYGSGFISTSMNPELAQVFAVRDGDTIYKLQIQANRLIWDADNIGGPGKSKEILVLGAILPSEFIAVKVNNTPGESELLHRPDTFKGKVALLRHSPSKMSDNTSVRNEENWKKL